MELLEERKAWSAFTTRMCGRSADPRTRRIHRRASVALSAETIAEHDAVLVATDHDAVDYGLIAKPCEADRRYPHVMRRRGFKPDTLVLA